MEWISVKDKMPEEDVDVLVRIDPSNSDQEIFVTSLFCGRFYNWYDQEVNVTHWMPLPNPPKDTQERLVEASNTKYIPLKD